MLRIVEGGLSIADLGIEAARGRAGLALVPCLNLTVADFCEDEGEMDGEDVGVTLPDDVSSLSSKLYTKKYLSPVALPRKK